MSDHIQDLYDTRAFSDLLDSAERNASTDFEEAFTSDLREQWEQWGERMYLSERQQAVLERIADQQERSR